MFTLVEAATRLRPRRTSGRRSALLAVGGALALAVTGCGGDDGDGSSSTSSGSSAKASVSTLEVSGFGKVLATPGGKPLFVLTAAKGQPGLGADDVSAKCTAKCAKQYKALAADGDPGAGPGVDADKLGTDGDVTTYEDQALYTHTGEGLISGAGVEEKGGATWYLIGTDGKPITQTAEGGY